MPNVGKHSNMNKIERHAAYAEGIRVYSQHRKRADTAVTIIVCMYLCIYVGHPPERISLSEVGRVYGRAVVPYTYPLPTIFNPFFFSSLNGGNVVTSHGRPSHLSYVSISIVIRYNRNFFFSFFPVLAVASSSWHLFTPHGRPSPYQSESSAT